MAELGDRLRDAIALAKRERKIGRTHLEHLLDVSKGTVTRWCKGSRIPTRDHVIALARELQVNVEWLEYGKGQMRGETAADVLAKLQAEVARIAAKVDIAPDAANTPAPPRSKIRVSAEPRKAK